MYQNFIVHSGVPSAFGIPECTINFYTLDLFFRRPDDDSVESKHVAIRILLCNKLYQNFIVHSEVPNAYGIPECTINFNKLDLFFGRPDDD
jgi:hypothetical protein